MQITSNILMVRPTNFGFNPATADNNTFQVNDTSLSKLKIRQAAVQEFDVFVEKLRAEGINVLVYQEKEDAISTDSVFPNNWFSCHEEGLLITYPMFSAVRRTERHQELIELLRQNFEIKTHICLEKWEKKDQFLEGTGSMILDRANKIVYACKSVRTNEALLDQFCYFMCFEKMLFEASDRDGIPIYHTNVMMALGTNFVIICLESIRDETEKQTLMEYFHKTNKHIIEISLAQMETFAGNMLQVKNQVGQPYLVMSSQAYHALSPQQIQEVEQFCKIIHSKLSIIEKYGGGSARCMMAEIFLPEKG